MSSKEMEFGGMIEDHNLRISMENLRLRDDCQREEHRGSHQVSLRGQSSELVD